MTRLQAQLWIVTTAISLIGLGGCGVDSTKKSAEVDDAGLPTEIHQNASGRVNEADIRASLINDDIEILIPLEKLSDGSLSGDARIGLFDVSAGEPEPLGNAELGFEQDTTLEYHRLVVTGVGADLERGETGAIVIDWRLDLPDGPLYGKRSLYDALGSLEVQLRGPTELSASGGSPLRVIVRDPREGVAVAGAEVVAVLSIVETDGDDAVESELFSGITDARGELLESIALPDGASEATLRVTVTHDGAQVWSSTVIRLRDDSKLYLSADKTIYKPGQTVELRALALDASTQEPVTATLVVFEAKDGKGNKVFRRSVMSDSYGVASIGVPTDTRVNEGDWTFSASVGETRSALTIAVTRYNLPKMRLEVSTDADFVLPGDTVNGSLDAFYLFGEPVIGAAVVLQAVTSDGALVTTQGGVTTAAGRYDFSFNVPAGMTAGGIEDGSAALLITATITDTADQTEQTSRTLPLAAAPLVVTLLSEFATVVPGIPNSLFVMVTDPLSRPLVAEVEISGVGSTLSVQTGANGIAELSFTPTSPDAVALSVRATDGANRTHSRSFAIGQADDNTLVLRSDRAVYAVGDTARLSVLVPEGIERVYFDVYLGAAGVANVAADVAGGEAMAELPITEAMRGLLLVDAFAQDGFNLLSTSRRLLVDPENQLRVTVEAGADTYLPGEEAVIRVSVVDAAGNPQVASVGLTVVNEATFVLGGEPTHSLQRFFSVDERVLAADVSVMGQGASELLGQDDSPARELLGRMLFSAAGTPTAMGFAYNSLAVELPQVVASLRTKVGWDIDQLLSRLQELVADGSLTAENRDDMLPDLSDREVDPFGQLYEVEINGSLIVFTSAGPDELLDTADDVTASRSTDYLFWGSQMSLGELEGGWAGDGDGAGDFFDGAANAGVDPNAAPPADDVDSARGGEAASGVSVRSDFRETVLVRPTLITDASGNASVSFPLADSITTWRASADASSRAGQVGSGRGSFRTFQDFFVDFDVPLSLTVGDRIELPAIVYNYLDTSITVSVTLQADSWFDIESAATQQVTLSPSEVRAVKFTVLVTEAGDHQLLLQGSAGGLSDAIARRAEVKPDGQPVDTTFSGELADTVTHNVTVPLDAIVGGTRVTLALTPGFAAEAVSGMDGMLKEPNGCFEQTTATAWPNTLVTTYLEKTGQLTEDMREQTIGLVTRGYQRLLTFESPTGGYNWWGDNDPGNRILTAIMLWHLRDLEGLIEIDTDVRDRTLDWLLTQQNADGSWDAGDALHAGNEVLGTSVARTTAFIAWALAHTGWADPAVASALGYLRSNMPTEADLYALALAGNALAAGDPDGAMTASVLNTLEAAKETATVGVRWAGDEPSWTGAGGDVGAMETTGLVAYALLLGQRHLDTAAEAISYIVSNKDSVGTWYNTQATVNALRALSAAASPMGSEASGTMTVRVNGEIAEVISITPENGDLYRQFDLTAYINSGANSVELEMVGLGEVNYQLVSRVYRPALPTSVGPFSLSVQYDTTTTEVGQPITASVRATNNAATARSQVMVRVGTAPGFLPNVADLQLLVDGGEISRYEITADEITMYLMSMLPGETRTLSIRMTPTLVVEGTAKSARIYSYYDPTEQETVAAETLTAAARL